MVIFSILRVDSSSSLGYLQGPRDMRSWRTSSVSQSVYRHFSVNLCQSVDVVSDLTGQVRTCSENRKTSHFINTVKIQ